VITRFVLLGCGHTGTTLLSGIFHISGFGSIEENWLFESRPLVDLNKKVLNGADQEVYQDFAQFFQVLEDRTNVRWCIKDPRLSLTIHDIYPLIPKPIKVLYNFRDPRNTVTHLLKERERWCPEMTPAEAVDDAENEYYVRNKSILEFIDTHPEIECLMINYDDLVDGKLQEVIDRFVGKPMNYEFIQPRKRKSPSIEVDDRLMELYDRIMDLYARNLGTCILSTKSLGYGPTDVLFRKIEYKRYFLMKRLAESFGAKKRVVTLSRIHRRIKHFIAGLFPGRFPGMYSTLDCKVREVPVQVAAYQLGKDKYIQPGDRVLDVGFGLGYGLRIMAENAGKLRGIEIDQRAMSNGQKVLREVPKIRELRYYDGQTIPYDADTFDVVTCIDVLEHVPDYMNLIREMLRVSKRVVLMSTPNRRPENTRPDGRPKNRWHLREWTFQELDKILQGIPTVYVDWNFLNGPWEGPFECKHTASIDTIALSPALLLNTYRP